MIFVPATHGSDLKKILENDVKESGLKFHIVEKAVVSVKRMLQISNPFKERTCNREDCIVCQTGGKGSCETPASLMKLSVNHVITSTLEKRQGVRILVERNILRT